MTPPWPREPEHTPRTSRRKGRPLAGSLGEPPSSSKRDEGPDGLDQPERPSSLKEAIDRSQRARPCEPKHEPRASFLKRVADQHGGDLLQFLGQRNDHPHELVVPILRHVGLRPKSADL